MPEEPKIGITLSQLLVGLNVSSKDWIVIGIDDGPDLSLALTLNGLLQDCSIRDEVIQMLYKVLSLHHEGENALFFSVLRSLRIGFL